MKRPAPVTEDDELSEDGDLSPARKYKAGVHLSISEESLPPAPSTTRMTLRTRAAVETPSSSSKKTDVMDLISTPPPLRAPPPSIRMVTEFVSCLAEQVDDLSTPGPGHAMSPRLQSAAVLKRALSIQELDDDSWLSSPFIGLVMARFAKAYDSVKYFSADFVGLPLRKSEYCSVTDILGKRFDFSDPSTPFVFLLNNNRIHWNLLRVQRGKSPELQLFEPLGLPSSRGNRAGLSLRSVPRIIIDWLDHCYPLPGNDSWLSKGCSAITCAQQLTDYDCGVACLLYAEKCGQGKDKEQINEETTQQHITEYREILKDFLDRTQARSDSIDTLR